jgi:transposase
VSITRLAQEHGVNANLLFKWRRHYRAGMFDQANASPALLPVSVVGMTANLPLAEPLPVPAQAAPHAGIDISFTGCTVRIGIQADMVILRAVLALLRR